MCPGDSILLSGNWVFEDTIIESSNTSLLGCDSIHVANIKFLPDPPQPELDIDCDALEIIVNIASSPAWRILWDNGDTSRQTTYNNGTQANIKLNALPNCEKQFILLLPPLPKESDLIEIRDTTVQQNQSIGLNPNEWTVLWSPSEITTCDTCINTTLLPKEDARVTVYLTHISGCIYESSFLIKTLKATETILVPNIFSPNGDGSNDTWEISPSPNILIKSCSIYNRWGNLVYSSYSGKVKWNGTFNGQLCNPAVYVFLINYIDENGENKTMTGDISLIR